MNFIKWIICKKQFLRKLNSNIVRDIREKLK